MYHLSHVNQNNMQTAKNEVLKGYPNAYCYWHQLDNIWVIFCKTTRIGEGDTAELAWHSALDNINKNKTV